MIKQKQFPLKRTGTCLHCFHESPLILVYGLSFPDSYDYLCPYCFCIFDPTVVHFQKCTSCGCFLNQIKFYPTDTSPKDQKPYCGLCFDNLNLRDLCLQGSEKKERKLAEDLIEKEQDVT